MRKPKRKNKRGAAKTPGGKKSRKPKRPTAEDISCWLRKIVAKGQTVQLFIKGAKLPRLINRQDRVGYFDDLDALARHAVEYSGKATGVYFTLNPLLPDLIARCKNRVEPSRQVPHANNDDVTRRRLLLIDVDSVRPGGISATKAEKKLAHEKSVEVFAYLLSLGWPQPMIVDSGNGYHLVYRIKIPTDDNGLISRVLKSLALRFDDKHTVIDWSVSDPVRLCRVPGTMACKGDSTTARPHRCGREIRSPEKFRIVKRSLLKSLADELPKAGVESTSTTVAPSHAVKQALSYIDKMPEAVSGEGGHSTLYAVACRLVIDFDLAVDDAMLVIQEYNERCKPPWRDAELRRKLVEADKLPGDRGALLLLPEDARNSDEQGQISTGEKAIFHGYVPDFSFLDRGSFLNLIQKFEAHDRFLRVFMLAVWQEQRSDAVVPDVLLRQIWWGSNAPRNWRPRVAAWLKDSRFVRLLPDNYKCPRHCPLHGSGVPHRHYQLKGDTGFDVLEGFVVRKFHSGHRKFGLFSDDKDLLAHRSQLMKDQKLLSAYWPMLIFGDSPRIGITPRQQRLMLGMLRELTYDRRKRREVLVENARVPVGRAGTTAHCRLLDKNKSYVVFGGNGSSVFKGKGYVLQKKGWLKRAGYNLTYEKNFWTAVSMLFDDLHELAEIFQLTVVGYNSDLRKWRDLGDMRLALNTDRGREVLEGCRIRIFAPDDYLTLWRFWFSMRLGFDWIPDSRGDSRGVPIEPDAQAGAAIRNAADVRVFLKENNLTQKQLADRLECSAKRVSRHLNGQCNSPKFFREVEQFSGQTDVDEG